jgi:hypothetical protein
LFAAFPLVVLTAMLLGVMKYGCARRVKYAGGHAAM